MNSIISKHTLINSLTDAYVVYELKSRGLATDYTTMRTRKMKLFEIMNSGSQDIISRTQYLTPSVNLNQCASLLTEAECDLASDKEKFAEIVEIRSMFLEDRIRSIDVSNEEGTVKKSKEDLLLKIIAVRELITNVSVTLGNDELSFSASILPENQAQPQRLITVQPNQFNDSFFAFNIPPNRNSQPLPNNLFYEQMPPRSSLQSNVLPHGASSSPQCCTPNEKRNHRDPKVWSWAIRYSADDKSKSAIDFVQKLKDHAVSRKVDTSDMLDSMTDLLEGSALKWFRVENHREKFRNFQDFMLRLLEEFEPFYRVETRLDIIKRRQQKADESIVAFFSDMQNAFLTLTNIPSERDQINIIRRNLLPKYITELGAQVYTSIYKLKEDCKLLELNAQIIQNQNRSLPKNPSVGNSFPSRFGSFRLGTPSASFGSQAQFLPQSQSSPQTLPPGYNPLSRQNTNRAFMNNQQRPPFNAQMPSNLFPPNLSSNRPSASHAQQHLQQSSFGAAPTHNTPFLRNPIPSLQHHQKNSNSQFNHTVQTHAVASNHQSQAPSSEEIDVSHMIDAMNFSDANVSTPNNSVLIPDYMQAYLSSHLHNQSITHGLSDTTMPTDDTNPLPSSQIEETTQNSPDSGGNHLNY